MAKATLLYNIIAYEGTASVLASDPTIYTKNALIFVTTGVDAGKFKRGDGTKTFAQLGFVEGATQA